MFSLWSHFSFDNPWMLGLLLPIPWVWKVSAHSLSGMARGRKLTAIGLRTAVLSLLVLALAELQHVKHNKQLTVFYLLDISRSIPLKERAEMVEYANRAVFEQRHDEDRAGVIVFGREGVIEVPPFNDNLPLATAIESQVDPEHSNLAGAIKLAQAAFPEDAAKRIVVISDGNQNVGDALEQARKAADSGIGIDVVPIEYSAAGDLRVDKLAIPADVRKSEPFYLRVVLDNASKPSEEDSGDVAGRLTILQKAGGSTRILGEERVVVPPGKKVFTIGPLKIEQPNFYAYEAEFSPENPDDDGLVENNKASVFTQVRGAGRVLIVESEPDEESPAGGFDELIERLRNDNLEVDTMSTGALFTRLEHLAPYDTVVLANVPREKFSPEQVEMLVQNTQQLGCGLVMLGGPNSFGAGGWTNSRLEEAMPVDFQIKDAKVVPRGALALIMHASEMADGNYWQKVIAKEAIKLLGEDDYAGLIHYGSRGDSWLWQELQKVGGMRSRMLGSIDRMAPGDMPDFDPGLELAAVGFEKLDPGVQKHMIVISDGDPTPPSAAAVQALRDLKVSVASVAVGAHGVIETNIMRKLATDTGGKFYPVTDPRALPKIFQKEARRVARPLIYENAAGFATHKNATSEMLRGIAGDLPPITGLVMTQKKPHPLVETPLLAQVPEPDTPVLAGWVYGVGKTVALTTDAGARWATRWPEWAEYRKLFTQVVRWSMRPAGDQGKYSIQADLVDGRVKVLVTALDDEDAFRNFLDIRGMVVGPELAASDLSLRQVAPGRYVGEFEADGQGTYHVALSAGADTPPLRVGVNVPYSAEFRDRSTNATLLENMAALAPKDGQPGLVIRDETGADTVDAWVRSLLQFDSFRHDLPQSSSRRDLWPLLLLIAGCLFFGDVFVRRVAVDFVAIWGATERGFKKVFGGKPSQAPLATMERLRGKKAEIAEQLEQRRAGARFEPEKPAADTSVLDRLEPPPQQERERPLAPSRGAGLAPEQQAEEQSYTARLLKAKKKVWEDRGKEP